MNDWSVIMINANAEMKNKTKEEITQVVMKELGMRQNAINARLKDKPAHTHKNALIVMIAQGRHKSAVKTTRRTEMSDWSVTMSLTAAEMRNNTTEEVMQIVMKELGMRQSVVDARLKDKPARTHKMILMAMIVNARYQATKRADSIRDRRQKVEKLLKN